MFLRRILLSAAVVAAALACVAPVVGASLPGKLLSGSDGKVETATSSPGAILSGRIAPGEPLRGSITVSNTGARAAYRLDAAVQGNARLARALRVRVVQASDGRLVYAGSLAGLRNVALGSLGSGDSLELRFSAVLPVHAGNALSGTTLTASFCWTATGA